MTKPICLNCNINYPSDDLRWKCECGAPLNLQYEPAFHLKKIKNRKPTMWRYREAIPLDPATPKVSFDEGFTPLIQARIGGKPLLLKQEQIFPTGSFKDRGASTLITRAKELGVSRIVEDSSGNAGAAVAAYAAQARIPCDIYVPESASPAKLAQIQLYGATLHKIPGTREDTARAALNAAKNCFYASHVWNPYFFQGTKTCAFEIWEQLGSKAPDTLIIPTGHGTLTIGVYIGFQDLLNQKLIPKLPKIIVVQAENCAPIYHKWKNQIEHQLCFKSKTTIAEGIAITQPPRANQIIDIVNQTGGSILTVTETEIKAALVETGKQGWHIEPTSATAVAAFQNYPLAKGETLVLPFTGHGLKSTEKFISLSNNLTSNKKGHP